MPDDHIVFLVGGHNRILRHALAPSDEIVVDIKVSTKGVIHRFKLVAEPLVGVIHL